MFSYSISGMGLLGKRARRLVAKAELFGAALSGVQAPKVHGQMSGHGDDGFLTLRAGGPRAFG